MKTKHTTVRLFPITLAKIKRIYGLNLRQFIEVALELSENNDYFKNKMIESAEKRLK